MDCRLGALAYRPYPPQGVSHAEPLWGTAMLHEFLTVHRDELIERCRFKSTLRAPARTREVVRPDGVPSILDQLIDNLRSEHATATCGNVLVFDPSARQKGINAPAAQHGRELLRNGFPVEEIVYGYGDLCQAVTDLAVEHNTMIQAREFRTLNHCLDQAIADALISYSASAQTPMAADNAVQRLHERLGFFVARVAQSLADSHRRARYQQGQKHVFSRSNRCAGSQHDRDAQSHTPLTGRRAGDRGTAGASEIDFSRGFHRRHAATAALEAHARNCVFVVEPIDTSLAICVDQELFSRRSATCCKTRSSSHAVTHRSHSRPLRSVTVS